MAADRDDLTGLVCSELTQSPISESINFRAAEQKQRAAARP